MLTQQPPHLRVLRDELEYLGSVELNLVSHRRQRTPWGGGAQASK
jgi:hypothetical protein